MFMRPVVICFAVLAHAACSHGHEGRRMDIVVVNAKIYAQGYNSGAYDEAPFVRPYQNAIHEHWSQLGGNYFATLPGFDVTLGNSFTHSNGNTYRYGYRNDAMDLVDFDLSMELVGAGKWTNPMAGQIILSPLDPGEVISVGFGSTFFDTDDIGSSAAVFDLVTDWDHAHDLDLNYSINVNPTGTIYFLEWVMTSENPLINSSDSIFTIHVPPGQLHHRALELEDYLGFQAFPVLSKFFKQ
jgi:hypothetical protein